MRTCNVTNHLSRVDVDVLLELNSEMIFISSNFNRSDLLQTKKDVELKVAEHYERGVYVDGLVEFMVQSPEQVMAILAEGQARRHTGATMMNAESSRSHSIFRVTVESRESESTDDGAAATGAVRVATLNLVDLAGSERVAHTKAAGLRLKEGGAINRSLLYLSEVIHKLSERQYEVDPDNSFV